MRLHRDASVRSRGCGRESRGARTERARGSEPVRAGSGPAGLAACVTANLLLLASGCAPGDAEGGRLDFALTLPAADVSEIVSIGFFALDLDPAVLSCDDYVSGGLDPIATRPDAVVAGTLETVRDVGDGVSVVFSAIPVGRWTVLVECYDGGGSRIFLGCGEARVEAGRTTEIRVTMFEDPLLGP